MNTFERYRLRRIAWAVPLLAVALPMTGCTRPPVTHGHMVALEDLEKLDRPNASRDDVVQVLGSPSTVALLDDEIWYYIGTDTETFAFFKPDVLDRRVVSVAFNDQGIVKHVEVFGLERGRDITPVDRETPTTGSEISAFDQIIGNIGRFNRDENKKGP